MSVSRCAFVAAILVSGYAGCGRWADSTIPPFVPRVTDVAVDGNLVEWQGVARIPLHPGDPTLDGAGDFGRDDLAVEAQLGWSSQGLFFAFRWEDDVRDVHVLPRDSSRWLDDEGRARDRMYAYDNISVAVRLPQVSYGVWMTARSGATALQHAVRREVTPGQPSPAFDVMPAVAAGEADDGSWFVELGIPWSQLNTSPTAVDSLDIQFIIPDSDWPGLSLREKAPRVKYVARRGWVKLDGRP
jgi:hypothetical protein